MRWPLRLQIMLPMAAIMLLTVVVVGGLGAFLAARATKARIAAQIAGVAQILEASNFPLSDAVLQQMKSLSGAEMMLVDPSGRVLATSGSTRQFEPVFTRLEAPEGRTIELGNHLWIRNEGFFHTRLNLTRRRGNRQAGTLHIFYPEDEYRRAWQRSVYPSLAFVVVALPVVMGLAAMTSATISRRMRRLQGQVERIAHGEFEQLVVADRDDEIRALGQAVNRMAAMLTDYEQQVRRTERMQTLARLGGGMAHQLRNSATGCSMALDLHAEICPAGESCENLAVAKQQLRLMEEYIQRFLQLGRPARERHSEPVDLSALLDEVLSLVQPTARHHGIDLEWVYPPMGTVVVAGDATELGQLMVNLLVNGIEAAAHHKATTGAGGRVVAELAVERSEKIVLSVLDAGGGPADALSERLFDPFVSDKPEGAGLGLSVVRDIVDKHGGHVHWQRSDGMTQFVVELPAIEVEVACA